MIQTPRLLITDDDRDFRETLGSVFEARGFETILAADGTEALAIVGQRSIHVGVVDFHMPRLNGLETVRRLRQQDICLPFILVSAELTEAIRIQAEQFHVFSVLSKSVTISEITKVVHRAMQDVYNWSPAN